MEFLDWFQKKLASEVVADNGKFASYIAGVTVSANLSTTCTKGVKD